MMATRYMTTDAREPNRCMPYGKRLSRTKSTFVWGNFRLDEACPVPPELAIEIISLNQTFGEITEKATDYLNAGVSRVWIVDPKAKSITVFYPDAPPQTKRGDATLADSLLEGLQLTTRQVFHQAGLPS